MTRISEQLITAEQLAMRKVQCAEELEVRISGVRETGQSLCVCLFLLYVEHKVKLMRADCGKSGQSQALRSEVEAMESRIIQEQRNEAEYKSQKQKVMMARDAQIEENDRKEREVKKKIDHINFEMSTLNDRNAEIRRAQDRNREEHLQKVDLKKVA